MGITIAGSTNGGAINGGNITLTYPSGTNSSGNCAIVNVTQGTSKTIPALTVTTSSGFAFTQIVGTLTNGIKFRFGVFRRIIQSANETQITITGAGGSTDSGNAILHVFTGVDNTTPEDVAPSSAVGGATQPDSPSITVNSCACAIITTVGVNLSNGTLTAPSSFTNVVTNMSTDTNPSGAGQAWYLWNSTSPIDPAAWTSSLSGSILWAAGTIALRPFVPTFTYQDLSVTSAESLMREAGTTVIRSY